MKVNELFEAAQGEPGQGGKLKGGAYHAPGYDEDRKQLVGSVLDWLDGANITKDDVAVAVAKIKKDPIFGKLEAAGLKYVEKPASEKNGTFTFQAKRKYGHNDKEYTTNYKVYANGQLRYTSAGSLPGYEDTEYMGKLKSPKPRFRAGDPVGSLLQIYKDALQELLTKWEKTSSKK